MIGALILTLIINLVIPGIGFFVSYWIQNDIGSKIQYDPVIVCNILAVKNINLKIAMVIGDDIPLIGIYDNARSQ